MKTDKGRGAKQETSAATAEAAGGDPGDWRWADPAGLEVNPAFQGLIPLQSRGEFQALEQSLLAEGCRDPVTVWKGHNVVLDGHTRRQLCLGHNKQVKVREVELPDERAAVEYILTIQRQRRNLTREAMSYFRGAEYNAVKRGRGGRRARRDGAGGADASTALCLAEKYGVSSKTIKRDGVFARAIDALAAGHGGPEVRRRLLGADVRLTQGAAVALARLPADERKAAVDALLERGELPRVKAAAPAPRARDVAQSIVARLKSRGEDHARSVLRQMARLLGMEVDDKTGDE